MNYFKLHIGDYLKKTQGFSQAEHGAYLLLIFTCYTTEKGVAQDEVYEVARATTPVARKAVDKVLAKKFELRDGHYFQARIIEEVAAYQVRANTNREVGKLGGRPKKKNPNGSESETRTVSKEEPNGNPNETPAINPVPRASSFSNIETPPTSPTPELADSEAKPEKPSRISGIETLCRMAKALPAPGDRMLVDQWIARGATDAQISRALTDGRMQKRDQPLHLRFVDAILERQMRDDASAREIAQKRADETRLRLEAQREEATHASPMPDFVRAQVRKPAAA